MPYIFCEYCHSHATVYVRFGNPIMCKDKEVTVLHLCALHCVHTIINEKTNVCDVRGVNSYLNPPR
jgi:hypothetical protein